MSRSQTFFGIIRETAGTTMAEFALILPIVLVFLFGIMDAGAYAWRLNRDEKATQMGARMAVVTDPVASGLATAEYVGQTVGGTTLTQGDTIPAAALGLITCTNTACTCTTAPCPATIGFNSTAFGRIVARMQAMEPQITASNVVVEYRGSGLGFAGDPNGMQIAPLTSVRLQSLTFRPLTLMLLKASLPLPSFAYTLSMEDGSGQVSN